MPVARVEVLEISAAEEPAVDLEAAPFVAFLCRACEAPWLMRHCRELIFCPYCGRPAEPVWNDLLAPKPPAPPGSQHPETN